MLFCCGCYLKPDRVIELFDTPKYSKRRIEIVECPKCGLRAELSQYNKEQKLTKYFKPKKKHTTEFIKIYESQPYIENIRNYIKKGTKAKIN